MRNLEECKAEVFCRSEERIKKRKKAQKYMLAFGSTFALCVTVCSVLVMSGVLNQGHDTAENDQQMIKEDEITNPDNIQDSDDRPNQDVQDVQENMDCVYVQAEIVEAYGRPQMEIHKVTDEIQVAELSEMIQSILDNEEGVLREETQDFDTILSENENQDSNEDALNELSSGGPLRNTDYVISFKSEDGKFWYYALKGSVLLDLTEKKALALTAEELSDLIAAMED